MKTTRAGYDTRTYNLAANVPQALPSAREFLIISATVDISALGFNLGDNNGDFEIWPFGFAIGVQEGSTKARIQSTVAQTVVVAMIDGIATVKDNRFAPGAGSLPVTMIDGANVALGARVDAAATTDVGTFSLIALFKRMLTRMGPVTSVDGGLVSIGATTDAAATTDAGPFSLIALIKRLLGKTGGASTYATLSEFSAFAGSPTSSAVFVGAGSNLNGILVLHYSLSCGGDPTAFCSIGETGSLARVYDSQSVVCGVSFIIPAGRQLAVSGRGLFNISVAYTQL